MNAHVSFNDVARVILSADPASDTAATLADALQFGEREFRTATINLANSMRIATDALSTDAEANAARSEIADLTARVERIDAAFKMLTKRQTSFVERSKVEKTAAERKAAIERHQAIVARIRQRYPSLVDEIVEILAELVEAEKGCEALHLRGGVDFDSSIGRALGVINVIGPGSGIRLPDINGGNHRWPVRKGL